MLRALHCLLYFAAAFPADVHAAGTIKIGLVAEITGQAAEAGMYTVNGAKLAIEDINKAGGVLGVPVELHVEDSQGSNPGAVLAFTKLFSRKDIPAIVGPIRSTQIQAASPSIARAGIPVMIGGTDPSLTRVNNRWVFRCRPNDLYSSRVIADFGVNDLKLKKWAIVHSTDAFGNGGMNALTAELKKFGIEPVLVQGFTNNTVDFTPIVLSLKRTSPETLATYIPFSTDQGIFAKQLQQLGVQVRWVGSPTTVSETAMKLAGSALHGSYAVTDFHAGANDEARAYSRAYRERYKIDADNYSAWTYDALHLLALAINNAGNTDPEAVRKAIVGIRGYIGAEGVYNFDESGEGVRGYNVVRNDNGKVVFIKRVDFDR
ncbi:MAG TPA: ABC transporter substrate-binding protein [Burkholderiales bacterium]|jgi:branched-chain amino acid transport system substrate-binding protein|nr:ABC transporter substrate-binding protein [Burkholderiales bacterium]